MAEFVFEPAVKEQEKARVALEGPSGSGKTWSSLAIATGLGQRIALIDTEKRSARKYASDFAFHTLALYSYDPRDLPKALAAAAAAEFDVVIVDSLSHFWMGTNGMLQQVDRVNRNSRSGNSWSAWKDVTPMEQDMIDALLTYPGHVIVTMRTKTEWVVEEVNGKKTPTKIGTKAIQRDGLEYEFDLVGDLDQDNTFSVSKTRISTLQGKVIQRPGPELGQLVREWLDDGVKLPTVRDYIERLNAATDADQVRALYREVNARNLGPAPCTNAAGQSMTLMALITERGAQLGGKVAPPPAAPPPGQVQRSNGTPPDEDPWATPAPATTTPTTAPAVAAAAPEQAAASQPETGERKKPNQRMLATVNAEVKKRLGGGSDADRFALIGRIIGREIATTNDLSFDEAKLILVTLTNEALFHDLQAAIEAAPDPDALEKVYQQAREAHGAGRLTDAQFAELGKLGEAANEDFANAAQRQPAGVSG